MNTNSVRGFVLLFAFVLTNFSLAQSHFNVLHLSDKDEYRFIWGPEDIEFNTSRVCVKVKDKKGVWRSLSGDIIIGHHRNYNQVSNRADWVKKIQDEDSANENVSALLPNNISKTLSSLSDRKNLALGINLDYNNALTLGFAFVYSGKLSKKETVFGLFETGGNVPLAQCSTLKQGDLRLNDSLYIVYRRATRQNTLNWFDRKVDYNKHLVNRGIRVYKKIGDQSKQELSEKLLLPYRDDNGFSFSLKDKSKLNKGSNQSITYSVEIETVFDTEYLGAEIIFDPTSVPQSQLRLVMIEAVSSENQSIKLRYGLKDSAQNKFVESFSIYREEKGASEILIGETDQWDFIDSEVLEKKTYSYKIVANLINGLGTELAFSSPIFCLPINRTQVPSEFKYDVRKSDDGMNVLFTWIDADKKNTQGYFLYEYYPENESLVKVADLIENPSYSLNVVSAQSEKVKYCVSHYDINGYESSCSDTIEVVTPSNYLPSPYFSWIKNEEEKTLTLEWKYKKEYYDLKGFQLYIDGELFVKEDKLTPNTRLWTETQMTRGYYNIQLKAISIYGVESDLTPPTRIKFK